MSSKEASRFICGHLGYMKYANTRNLEEKLFYINQGQTKRPTVPTTGCIGVAITTTMVQTIQQTIVTTTIRLILIVTDGCRAAL